MSVKYLDYTGLQTYNTSIKDWANSSAQVAYKTVLSDESNLYFYKKANAVLGTDTPDKTIPFGGGSLATKLTALAAIIDAAATYDDTTHTWTINLDNSFSASTVVGAINELLADIGDVSAIDVNPDPSGTEPTNLVAAANFLASEINAIMNDIGGMDGSATIATNNNGVVTLKAGVAQEDGVISNSTGADITLSKVATTGAATDVSYSGTISGTAVTNVDDALDALQTIGDDKTVYLQDSSSGQTDYAKVYKLYQGADASDMTQNTLVGTINIPKDLVVQSGRVVVNPTGQPAGTYIELVIQNQATPIYINVADLVDAYTGGTTDEVTVAISNTNEITATINKVAATKVIYRAAEGADPEVTVKDKIDAVSADIGTQITSAINALDTLSDVAIATEGNNGEVTLLGSIKEENGIIDAGSASNVVFNSITTAEIQALF